MDPTLLTGIIVVLLIGLIVWAIMSSKSRAQNPVVAQGATSPLQNFDLARYLGLWYEQARVPVYFENGLSKVTAEYSLLPAVNGQTQINVKNCGFNASGQQCANATATPTSVPGVLDVSFFPGVSDKYIILYLIDGPNQYEVSVVGSKDKSNLWLLTRTKDIASNLGDPVEFLKSIGRANGYSEQVLNTIQRTAQM